MTPAATRRRVLRAPAPRSRVRSAFTIQRLGSATRNFRVPAHTRTDPRGIPVINRGPAAASAGDRKGIPLCTRLDSAGLTPLSPPWVPQWVSTGGPL